MTIPHIPVLLQEVLAGLNLKTGDQVIDGTLGAGGHSQAILEAIGPSGRLLAFDVDPVALALAQTRLAAFRQAHFVQANFEQISAQAQAHNFEAVQGILVDLGVSSMQFDQADRGFSFQDDGPLDMRMGPQASQSAADLINYSDETELANLIYRYGEERQSRRIARTIVQQRPISRTKILANIIVQAVGERRGQKIHPATRTFQALRIAVNDELGVLERFLPQAVNLLASEGRLAVISFHSLEDRLVKQFFQQESRDCICPPQQPICTCQHQASLKIISKKPLTASPAEREHNPRARSAKLRVAEKK